MRKQLDKEQKMDAGFLQSEALQEKTLYPEEGSEQAKFVKPEPVICPMYEAERLHWVPWAERKEVSTDEEELLDDIARHGQWPRKKEESSSSDIEPTEVKYEELPADS